MFENIPSLVKESVTIQNRAASTTCRSEAAVLPVRRPQGPRPRVQPCDPGGCPVSCGPACRNHQPWLELPTPRLDHGTLGPVRATARAMLTPHLPPSVLSERGLRQSSLSPLGPCGGRVALGQLLSGSPHHESRSRPASFPGARRRHGVCMNPEQAQAVLKKACLCRFCGVSQWNRVDGSRWGPRSLMRRSHAW